MDNVMMFTDCQLWNNTGGADHIHSLWVQYKQKVAPKAKLYLFDLAGYGQTPLRVIQDDGPVGAIRFSQYLMPLKMGTNLWMK